MFRQQSRLIDSLKQRQLKIVSEQRGNLPTPSMLVLIYGEPKYSDSIIRHVELTEYGEEIGSIEYQMSSTGWGFIYLIWVFNQFRRRDYGRELMEYALKDMAENGVHWVLAAITGPPLFFFNFGFRWVRSDWPLGAELKLYPTGKWGSQ